MKTEFRRVLGRVINVCRYYLKALAFADHFTKFSRFANDAIMIMDYHLVMNIYRVNVVKVILLEREAAASDKINYSGVNAQKI